MQVVDIWGGLVGTENQLITDLEYFYPLDLYSFSLAISSFSRSVSGYLTAARISTLQLCGTMSILCWITEFTLPPSTPPNIC